MPRNKQVVIKLKRKEGETKRKGWSDNVTENDPTRSTSLRWELCGEKKWNDCWGFFVGEVFCFIKTHTTFSKKKKHESERNSLVFFRIIPSSYMNNGEKK